MLLALPGTNAVSATIPRSSEHVDGNAGILDEMLEMANLVETVNACAMPGCTIKYDSFVSPVRVDVVCGT